MNEFASFLFEKSKKCANKFQIGILSESFQIGILYELCTETLCGSFILGAVTIINECYCISSSINEIIIYIERNTTFSHFTFGDK